MKKKRDRVDEIAIRVLEIWLLLQGFILIGDDEIRDYGPHRVWTVSARCDDIIQAGDFWPLLVRDISDHNKHSTYFRFHPYDVKVYPSAVGGTSNIYASIFQ